MAQMVFLVMVLLMVADVAEHCRWQCSDLMGTKGDSFEVLSTYLEGVVHGVVWGSVRGMVGVYTSSFGRTFLLQISSQLFSGKRHKRHTHNHNVELTRD